MSGYTSSNQLAMLAAARAPSWVAVSTPELVGTGTGGDAPLPASNSAGVSTFAKGLPALKGRIAAHTRRELGQWSACLEVATFSTGVTYTFELSDDGLSFDAIAFNAATAASADAVLRGLYALALAEGDFSTYTFALDTTAEGVAYRLRISRATAFSLKGSSQLRKMAEVGSFDLDVYALPRRGYGVPPAESSWYRLTSIPTVTVDDEGWLSENIDLAGIERLYLRMVDVDDPASATPAHGSGVLPWLHLHVGPGGLE